MLLCLSSGTDLKKSRHVLKSLSLCNKVLSYLILSLSLNITLLQLSLWVATLMTSNFVPVVSLLGVVGNALNVAVFFRQGLRERVNVCLFSLALADLAVALRVWGGDAVCVCVCVRETDRQNSNSKTLILKDSSIRSILTYLTAGPCYTTDTNKHGYTRKR